MEINIKDIGPVEELNLDMRPGVNVLEGRNGSGKTTTCAAVITALTGDSKDKPEFDLTPRYGADHGMLKVDGVPALTVAGTVKKIGKQFQNRLASLWPIADLVDSGMKKEAGEKARIKAFLQLANPEVTREVIETLADNDVQALEYLDRTESIAALTRTDIIDATERIRRGLHNRKAEFAVSADQAEGEMRATAPKGTPAKLSGKTVEQAQAEYENAVRRAERVAGEVSGRKQRETERGTIREHLGERPKVAVAQEAKERAYGDYCGANKEVEELERGLIEARNRQSRADTNYNLATATYDRVKREAEAWDKNKAVLTEPLTGPTEDDAAQALAAVKEAKAALAEAQEMASYNQAVEQIDVIGRQLKLYIEQRDRFKNLAETVTARLGKVLAQTGAANVTVNEQNQLCVVYNDGRNEPLSALSFGQRVRFIIPLLSNSIQVNGKQLVILDWIFWNALTHDKQQEVAEIFAEADIYALTERPEECDLRLVHFHNGESHVNVTKG